MTCYILSKRFASKKLFCVWNMFRKFFVKMFRIYTNSSFISKISQYFHLIDANGALRKCTKFTVFSCVFYHSQESIQFPETFPSNIRLLVFSSLHENTMYEENVKKFRSPSSCRVPRDATSNNTFLRNFFFYIITSYIFSTKVSTDTVLSL